jgi:hypothetical protein
LESEAHPNRILEVLVVGFLSMYLGHNVGVLRDLWEAIRTALFGAVYGYAYDEE